MNTIRFVYEALKWAFHTFIDNIHLFIKLFFISGIITIATTVISFGIALLWVPFYLTLCYINIALKLYDGRHIKHIKEFFVGGKLFVKGLIALYIYAALVIIGCLAFILPGLYIASRYYYIIYCIMSDQKEILSSFTCSRQLTKQLPWHGLLLLICATILGGSFFFLPVAALMNVYAYKHAKQNRREI